MIEVKVPAVGESISEVQVSNWLKKEGEWVANGTDIVELETEKASVQIPAPVSGYIRNIAKKNEDFASVDDLLCEIEEAEQSSDNSSAKTPTGDADSKENAAQKPPVQSKSKTGDARVMPAAARMMTEQGLSADQIEATGPGGRILKEDVARHADQPKQPAAQQPSQPAILEVPAKTGSSQSSKSNQSSQSKQSSQANNYGETENKEMMVAGHPARTEEVKPMSMIRRTIATRLVEAQHTAALLTTFNEIDMQPVMTLRSKYKEVFAQKHGVKLGFMSFFSKAACEALQRFPSVNAEVRENSFVYRNYCDIGIAIGGGKGLLVPVLRNVEYMSFAQVERSIGEYSKMAMENRVSPADLQGGTFTISNGGIYGSLLSTPIVNPPQSAILGLHSIQERPIAVDGQVVIRPMMYVALTYDHRIIDGREAVTFLRTIKEIIEDPTRLFLEV